MLGISTFVGVRLACRAPARCCCAPARCWAPARCRRCQTLSTCHSRELTRVLSYCYTLPSSCTLPPCSRSLLGYYSTRLLGSCSRQPTPNSVFTSHILSHGLRMLTRVSPLVMTDVTSAPHEPSGGHAAPAAAVSPGQGDAAAALRGLHLGQEAAQGLLFSRPYLLPAAPWWSPPRW